jgi:hypothetical protein
MNVHDFLHHAPSSGNSFRWRLLIASVQLLPRIPDMFFWLLMLTMAAFEFQHLIIQ